MIVLTKYYCTIQYNTNDDDDDDNNNKNDDNGAMNVTDRTMENSESIMIPG